MNKIAVIVAGGSGQRMGTEIPKQFLKIGKLPILIHTMKVFHKYDSEIDLRIVLPEEQIETWKELCEQYSLKIPHEIIEGGETRFHSVKNGIEGIPSESLIAIHDGVRPLVSAETLERTYQMAKDKGAAVPVMPLTESIREIDGPDSVARNRKRFVSVQTPQIFLSDLLLDAYSIDFDESFTDDASVIEAAGYKIYICEGNDENIKITSPKDIKIAEALLG